MTSQPVSEPISDERLAELIEKYQLGAGCANECDPDDKVGVTTAGEASCMFTDVVSALRELQRLRQQASVPLGTITHEMAHKMCHYLKDGCSKCPANVATRYGDGELGCYGIAFETLQMARSLMYEAALPAPPSTSPSRKEQV